MRTYGRTWSGGAVGKGTPTWVEVDTDANGYNDSVWLTTLCQVILLNRGEAPFDANFGIPAQQSVIQQVFPDYYMSLTQQQFAPHFAALTLAKVHSPTPTYRINVTTQQGVTAQEYVPVPF